MLDDQMMDELLRDSMAGEVPQLAPAFDARVMRRVRPRRLTPAGRVVIVVYVVVAAAVVVWAMRGVPMEAVIAAAVIGVPATAGAGAYGRRLLAGS